MAEQFQSHSRHATSLESMLDTKLLAFRRLHPKAPALTALDSEITSLLSTFATTLASLETALASIPSPSFQQRTIVERHTEQLHDFSREFTKAKQALQIKRDRDALFDGAAVAQVSTNRAKEDLLLDERAGIDRSLSATDSLIE